MFIYLVFLTGTLAKKIFELYELFNLKVLVEAFRKSGANVIYVRYLASGRATTISLQAVSNAQEIILLINAPKPQKQALSVVTVAVPI